MRVTIKSSTKDLKMGVMREERNHEEEKRKEWDQVSTNSKFLIMIARQSGNPTHNNV